MTCSDAEVLVLERRAVVHDDMRGLGYRLSFPQPETDDCEGSEMMRGRDCRAFGLQLLSQRQLGETR